MPPTAQTPIIALLDLNYSAKTSYKYRDLPSQPYPNSVVPKNAVERAFDPFGCFSSVT